MSFDIRLSELRKTKKLSQEELAKKIGVYTNVMGRYERGEAKPSIEVAAKLAQALEVSLDYLAGNTDMVFDKKNVKRILDVQRLSEKDAEHLYAMMDAFLRNAKARQTYVS